MLGTRRIEITSLPVRFWTITRFPNYVVVYRPETEPLQIIAVLHGERNIKAILGASESEIFEAIGGFHCAAFCAAGATFAEPDFSSNSGISPVSMRTSERKR